VISEGELEAPELPLLCRRMPTHPDSAESGFLRLKSLSTRALGETPNTVALSNYYLAALFGGADWSSWFSDGKLWPRSRFEAAHAALTAGFNGSGATDLPNQAVFPVLRTFRGKKHQPERIGVGALFPHCF
jgi:hypothetical protein